MRKYMVTVLSLATGLPESYQIVPASSRINAFCRSEGFTAEEFAADCTAKVDGRWLLISAPDYTAAVYRVIRAG